VNFEPQGEALLRDGKVKEALESYRGLITANPNAPVHHLQVARVLLEAGMGEAARAQAREAVKLDPNSALAQRTLAEILKHDLVGRDLRPGSDWAGAAEGYRAATRLDPDDHTAEGNLAILLEYDAAGRRYGGDAHLYAETGKTKEAHDLLLRAMDELNLDEPDDDYWYAFGRIAEEFGERETAIADYRKLQKPKIAIAIPTSSFQLAQNRLKAMGVTGAAAGQ
jgi:tetratricopeptide (TPR) repeat protein